VVTVINTLMQSSYWSTTAVIIAYDDSDGWYDHQMGPLVNSSFSIFDALTGTSACGTSGTTPQLPGPNSGSAPVNGRCGYGVRLPLLVISPWAKPNYVDHTVTDQTSVLRFIEDNWTLEGWAGARSMPSQIPSPACSTLLSRRLKIRICRFSPPSPDCRDSNLESAFQENGANL